jgi:hypothetical protein
VPVYTPLPDSAEYLMQTYGITAEQAGDGSPDVVWQMVAGRRPLLERPVEQVLATHGGLSDRAALERVLSAS